MTKISLKILDVHVYKWVICYMCIPHISNHKKTDVRTISISQIRWNLEENYKGKSG
jgi:hypothetical protein